MSACPQNETLLDLAYGELSGGDRASLERHVEACELCTAAFSRIAGTRDAFSRLPEAEPPAEVRSLLLREAAKGEHVAGSSGGEEAAPAAPGRLQQWIDRWLRPAMEHPALAAVAALVIVLGVAGALRMQGGRGAVDRVAEPSAPSEELAESGESEASSSAPERREPAGPQAEEAPGSYDMEAAQGRLEGSNEEQGAVGGERPQPDGTKASGGGGASAGTSGERPSGKERKAQSSRSGGKESRDLDAFADDAEDGAEGAPAPKAEARADEGSVERDFAESPASEPAPGPGRRRSRSEKAPAPKTSGAEANEAEEEASDAERDEEAWRRRMSERLAAAARDERCGDAAALAAALRERAPEYYRKRIEGAEMLAPCRKRINAERRPKGEE